MTRKKELFESSDEVMSLVPSKLELKVTDHFEFFDRYWRRLDEVLFAYLVARGVEFDKMVVLSVSEAYLAVTNELNALIENGHITKDEIKAIFLLVSVEMG